MPKSIIIEPEKVFARSTIHLSDIQVNAYQRTGEQERATYSPEEFLAIWQDMCAIRQFETILNEIKTKGAFQGLAYNHAGPAHLSIGQEAAAVGMAFSLTSDDHIYGSHRSHGEILAKGFSAIRHWSDAQLLELMKTYRDGALLGPVEKGYQGTVKGLALRFFIYGAYSEIFARETGFNRGLGGSMHAFFTPFGIYPNNAIVGGSGSIAPGAALFKRVNRKPGMVVCNIGDASFGCGPVWEGITFSAMDQYRKLWDASLGGGLPIIFNCMNNFYGMGGQPFGETMGMQFIARIGAGVNPEQMHAERVNGYDPLPVIDAFRRKRQVLEEGRGPVLLDTITLPHQRPLAFRRFELPLQGRSRALAGSRFDPRFPQEDGGDRGGRRGRAGQRQGVDRHGGFRNVPPGDRSGGQPARGSRLRTGGLGHVLQPASREVRHPAARVPARPLAKPQGAADQGESAHGYAGWKTRTQDEDVQHSGRHLRGHAVPLRDRPHHGGLRRGEPRLGRRLRRLSRPDRGVALPSAVQLADFRGGDCRRGRGIRARGRPGGGGADVCRLHGPRGR